MELLNTSIYKARKNHRCSYCNGIIAIGEKYESQSIKGDYMYTWKSHLRCRDISWKLKMYDECDEGVTMDDFYEIISQEYIKLQGDKEDYPYPEFQERLDFVCNHHGFAKDDMSNPHCPVRVNREDIYKLLNR